MLRRFVLAVAVLASALLVSRYVSFAVVVGGSMAPALVPGDVCLVIRDRDPEIGEVVLYTPESGGRSVLHRVVARDGPEIRTQGDANEAPDRDEISLGQVRGSVTRVFKLGALLELD